MKLTRLQKELTGWLIFFLMCTGAGIYYINHTPNEHPGIIRLHVVANSDTFQDQDVYKRQALCYVQRRGSLGKD